MCLTPNLIIGERPTSFILPRGVYKVLDDIQVMYVGDREINQLQTLR